MSTAHGSAGPARVSEVRRRVCRADRTEATSKMLVLAVESAPRLIRQLRTGLATRERELVTCPDPAEALLLLGRLCPDEVVLGEVGGRVDPIEFLRIARSQEPLLPIVVGANEPTSEFATHAVAAGASALVSRPYRPRQLLDAFGQSTTRPEPIDLDRLYLDANMPRIWLDGNEIILPAREFLVLRYLAQHTDRIVSRDELLEAAWGLHGRQGSNSLSVHITRLRRRLGDELGARARWIVAIRGSGYRLHIPPSRSSRSSSVHHAGR